MYIRLASLGSTRGRCWGSGDVSEFKASAAALAMCGCDIPAMCVRNLFDNSKAQPCPAAVSGESALKDLLKFVIGDANTVVRNGDGELVDTFLNTHNQFVTCCVALPVVFVLIGLQPIACGTMFHTVFGLCPTACGAVLHTVSDEIFQQSLESVSVGAYPGIIRLERRFVRFDGVPRVGDY